MVNRNPPAKTRGSQMQRSKVPGIIRKMTLPGGQLMEKVNVGNPREPGVYLVYYRHVPPSAWTNTEVSSGMAVATWNSERWGLNHPVIGHIGPLPILAMKQLEESDYPINQAFYIGSLKQGAMERCDEGPWPSYANAYLSPGRKGLFIFMMESESNSATPIAKFSTKTEKWALLKPKTREKYLKMMGMLNR